MDLLIAAIHHELATPVACIVLSLHAALRHLSRVSAEVPGITEARTALDNADEGCAQAMAVLHELRTLEPGLPTDLNQVLRTAMRLCRPGHPTATLHEDLAAVPLVLARPARMLRLFVNLLRNAFEAIDELPGGGAVQVRSRVGDDGSVLVEIQDEGPGIAPEHLPHVFEPFYTTKHEHGGTGVGLAICQRLIDEIGGRIRMDSRAGAGTTVHLVLPALPPRHE